MKAGKLFGVSVGPGDPELLTLKAVSAIRDADVVAVPNIGHKRQTALQIAAEHVRGKQILDCPTPMNRDHTVAQAAYEQTADALCALLEQGKTVAYLCLGDIGVYSSYIYVHELVAQRGYDARIIPGVTSFSAAAAKLGVSLCQGPERLVVAPASADDLDDVLTLRANKVLMKPARDRGKLYEKLQAHGLLDNAAMVANCGLPDEKIVPNLGKLETDNTADADYFSVVLVKEQ